MTRPLLLAALFLIAPNESDGQALQRRLGLVTSVAGVGRVDESGSSGFGLAGAIGVQSALRGAWAIRVQLTRLSFLGGSDDLFACPSSECPGPPVETLWGPEAHVLVAFVHESVRLLGGLGGYRISLAPEATGGGIRSETISTLGLSGGIEWQPFRIVSIGGRFVRLTKDVSVTRTLAPVISVQILW